MQQFLKFKILNKYLIITKEYKFGQVYKNLILCMGDYIDVGLQTSILPFTLLISSIAVGLYALIGFEVENDDDDSDSGSGGLMNPI